MQRGDECGVVGDQGLFDDCLEDLYENAPCGYLSMLPNGLIVRINATLLRWLGYPSDELTGKHHLNELMPVGYQVFFESHFRPLLIMQGGVKEFAFELLRKDGSRLPVLLNATQKCDESGTPQFVRVTVFDVTDRKSYERELLLAKAQSELAAKERSDFAAMVSHEIRSPLGAIIGLTEVLGATPLSETQQRYVRLLTSATDSLSALIEDVLVYSKVEAGKVVLSEQPFDVAELTYSLVERMRLRAEEKGLELRVKIDPIVPKLVAGDAIKIGQVLTNLLANAIKFTSHGSVTITISVIEESAREVKLDFRVIDTGIGIAHDRLLLIFREFEQESPETCTKYGGTGLGLAISKKLVELHGGTMFVESTQGEGSTFAVTLVLGLPAPARADAGTSANAH
jgi:PAS domain S-box-containing protein